MTEFQEKLRQQHEESMHRELEALLKTAGPAEAEVRRHSAVSTGVNPEQGSGSGGGGGGGGRMSQSWAFVTYIEQIFVCCSQRVRWGEFRSAGGTRGQRPPHAPPQSHTRSFISCW